MFYQNCAPTSILKVKYYLKIVTRFLKQGKNTWLLVSKIRSLSWNGWSLKKSSDKHHTMYYKVFQNYILNNFDYHYIYFSRHFLKTYALAVNFYFFFVSFPFFFFHFSKKKKFHRKCPYLKKISEKLYIMRVKVVKNTILNNLVIHYMVFPWTFLKRLSISTCVSQVTRFLKQAIKYFLLILKTGSRF